jgi:putative two-component system response regulator
MHVEPAGQLILVVDDNPFIASLLQHGLTAEGYQVIVASDGLEALEKVASHFPDLILLDLDLPYLNGDEVCRRLKSDPETQLIPVVIVTALGAFQNKLAAWDYGADDFLTKPFHLIEVTARCRSLLRIRRLIAERERAEKVLTSLVHAVEAKNPYTAGHSERVARLVVLLASELGLPMEDRLLLEKAGRLHDIGKISIPDAILNKPDQLSPAEYDIIKQHPQMGVRIVEPLDSMQAILPLIRWHHERMDGQGYPDGLHGEEIPLLVRILSVCDVYDSLNSDRPYRGKIACAAECLQIMKDNAAGGGLDPVLVDCFQNVVSKLEPAIPMVQSEMMALSPS